MTITSLENQFVKEVMKLKQKKYRDENKKFIVEGIKVVSEIPKSFQIDTIIISENEVDKLSNFSSEKVVIVSDTVFRKLSDTEEPQGVMAICYKKEYNIDEMIDKDKITLFLLDELQDPGNLGTIIRSADATKVDAIIISKNSVDLYNSKTIRATMASIFHLPIITGVDMSVLFEKLKKNNIKIMAASLNTDEYLYDINIEGKICVIIGNEAKGISKFASENADVLFKLPMLGQAESLNAGIAASVIMYELVRQQLSRNY